jgi:transcriptional regulator with XRE-family HTH domain
MQVPKFNPQAAKIGAIIRVGRTRKGMSQKELEGVAEISATMLCRYEKGQSVPSAIMYRKLNKILDLDKIEQEVFS